MRITDCVSTKSLITLSVFLLAFGCDGALGQTSAATKSRKKPATSAKCGQVRKSSKQKSNPPLLPCGPNITVTNATTSTDPKTVLVSVLLDESGKIVSARAVSGDPALYEKAVKAVNEMKFTPKRLSGRAVKTELNVKVVVDAGPK